ncbi:ribosomal protection tetracycline resistance protein [Friedmanniella endophytica]|uniref:Ribosomal protection tetracycline resistance protein n=1 Tax=Microlunatus kandeliicorticis TaxID=1759536 RepID=A0A7W3P7D4_9ACTN|nr:translation factor GTPase family protein [Microlunatus kandeliicorticis]MBA8795855.1 ribosomal protection tetracycline resistance protein [Microlunatus kandeliicorticis]
MQLPDPALSTPDSDPDRPTLNLGIVAHVDAGKTSLTERLLYAAGAIDAPGRVDDGTTTTDTLALERARGITIRAAVASFRLPTVRPPGEVAVNVIDTPGHHDFVAEVERALTVLDGAVLVVSAVEGVQAHTRLLLRTLRRLGIPTLVFVNKIDRTGARADALAAELAAALDVVVVPLARVVGLGTRDARSIPVDPVDPADRAALVEPLSLADDRLATAWLADPDRLDPARVLASLRRQSRAGRVHPLLYGSAITGAGVDQLMSVLPDLLPASPAPSATDDGGATASGRVFKIERDPAGRRVAYVRVDAGRLAVRDRVRVGGGRRAKITALSWFADGGRVAVEQLAAGQIGTVSGLDEVRIGDVVGSGDAGARPGRAATAAGPAAFEPPTLESVVAPRDPARAGALFAALTELAEQDPLIAFRRQDDELLVSLYGEVQQQVLEATLAADYGLEVDVRAARTLCVERLAATGEAVEHVGGDNPFLATVGLRVEPAPVGSGVSFALEVELGAMPAAFFAATEATVRAELEQGPAGWPVPDARVVMTHSRYLPRQSHAHQKFDKSMSSTGADFRGLTPLVLAAAVSRAGTVVCEPVHRFVAEFPADVLGAVLPVLVAHEAVPWAPVVDARHWCRVEGEVPAARVQEVRRRLPGLTRGTGLLETTFARYAPVTSGPAPRRPRRRPDAYRRKDYLLQVLRRVDTGTEDAR